jgi:hypothetical protein
VDDPRCRQLGGQEGVLGEIEMKQQVEKHTQPEMPVFANEAQEAVRRYANASLALLNHPVPPPLIQLHGVTLDRG